MENNNEIEEKGSSLEGLCGFLLGGGLAFLHSSSMYQLMERAGMYEPVYEVPLDIASAAFLGTTALFLGGIYVGSKIPGFINKLCSEE